MALTQEIILNFLLERGGKAKNSELLNTFKDLVNCSDPEEKRQNRELFKKSVNSIAVVKEIDDVKYVVIKKKFRHLLSEEVALTAQQPETGDTFNRQNTFCSPGYDAGHRSEDRQEGKLLNKPDGHNKLTLLSTSNEGLIDSVSNTPTGLTLQKSTTEVLTYANVPYLPLVRSLECLREETPKVKDSSLSVEVRTRQTGSAPAVVPVKPQTGTLNAELHVMHVEKDKSETPLTEAQKTASKPCALLLRMPPPAINIQSVDSDPTDINSEKSILEHAIERSPRSRRKQMDEVTIPGSPQIRRSYRTMKMGEEVGYPETIPLEPVEHQWLVKCAAGHWSHVYGLLMQDAHLAQKRDFMSGFTALHWAAKSNNGEILCKIIETAEREGVQVNVNAKTHGGYTPLHIAAIHDHRSIMALLVRDYSANVHMRDNSGKKPHHYLPKGVPSELRALLGMPQVPSQEASYEKQEDDPLPDLQRGFNTLSRLFQPHGGQKKKHKTRPGFYSVTDGPEDENVVGQRPSDIFH